MEPESERTRELRELAERTRDAALKRRRERFHHHWGDFAKCSVCGMRGEVSMRSRFRSLCGHGDDALVHTGYSYPR